MAITFDAFTADATPAAGNDSFTHAGGAGPRAALVYVVGIAPTDEVPGVTYGGVSMTELASSPKLATSGGEPGVIHAFLLNGIAGGSQTVAITTSASTVTHQGYCITLNADADLEVVDQDVSIDSASVANPSVTLSLGGRSAFCSIAFMSGQSGVAGITELSGWTPRHEVTTGSETAACYTYDTIGTADVTAGWTQTAEDALMYAVALAEVQGGGRNTRSHPLGTMLGIWRRVSLWLLMALCLSSPAFGQVSTNGMTLPDTSGAILNILLEPRLSTYRTRYNASPSTYPMSYESSASNCTTTLNSQLCAAAAAHQALIYQIQTTPRTCAGSASGNLDTCFEAKQWILDCLGAYGTAGCWQYNDTDGERYYGGYVILSTVWLWDEFDTTQRSDLTTWINRTVAAGLDDAFGDGRDDEGYEDIISNYNWGRIRNAGLWGIASRQLSGITMTSVAPCSWSSGHFTVDWCGDTQDTIAEALITEAVTRITNLHGFAATHRGGVFWDGREYGQYLMDYLSELFAIGNDYGVDWLNASPWWADVAWQIWYTRTPKETYHRSSGGAFVFQCDTYGATNLSYGRCRPGYASLIGSMTAYMLYRWDGTNLEPYLRYWQTQEDPLVHPWMRLMDPDHGAAGTNPETAGLPLDWWAVGSGRLVLRNTWTDTSSPSVWYLNLGGALGHHLNKDAGSFQAVSCGTGSSNDCYWVAKESSCYGLASRNLPQTDGDQVDCVYQWGQNVVATNHVNTDSGFDNEPPVLRLDRQADYVVGSVDLDAYNGSQPVTAHVRTFVYVRGLNALVKLDRVAVSAGSPVDMVQCSVAWSNPATDQYRCEMGSAQVMDVFQLSGDINSQSVSYNTRDLSGGSNCASGGQSNCDPQFRLESTVTCSTCYIVSVHHARASGGTAMSTPTITYTGGVITVGLDVGGTTATVTFNDGTTDTGGTVNGTAFQSGVDTVTSTTTTFSWDGGSGNQTRVPFLRR